MCIFEDKLWICGHFLRIEDVAYDKIAAYNGETWENVGSFGMYADALEVFNGELYAGGFNSWGLRRYLGGTEWEIFDVRPGNDIFCLKADTINTFLYVGGQFRTINGEIPSIGVAMWDGFNWNPMDYEHGNTVWRSALAVYRGDLYTGHGSTYDEENDTWNFFICRWDGEQWDSLGGGFSDAISALEVFQDELYIGGGFTSYDGQRSKGMRKMSFPDNGCNYIKPRINTYSDTFYIRDSHVEAQFYNNNPYVDSWEWDFGDGGRAYERNPLHVYTERGEYLVTVTVRDGECQRSFSKTIYVDDLTGIEEYENIDFHVFPNPSSGDFVVKAEMPNYNNAELKITGLNGHLLNTIPVTSNETIINTEYWKSGAYMCNLFVEGKLIRTEKLIKK